MFKDMLLLIPVLYAQNNYRPGFIITVQKDTIYGEIDYRTDKMNAKRCVFQSQGNDTEPVTLSSFRNLWDTVLQTTVNTMSPRT